MLMFLLLFISTIIETYQDLYLIVKKYTYHGNFSFHALTSFTCLNNFFIECLSGYPTILTCQMFLVVFVLELCFKKYMNLGTANSNILLQHL